MKIECNGGCLKISGVSELGTASSDIFRREICSALPDEVTRITLDLSETEFMDCSGLGALVYLRKAAQQLNSTVSLRVLNPTASVRHILQLTHMDGIFQLENRN